jgi:hypothetical protein
MSDNLPAIFDSRPKKTPIRGAVIGFDADKKWFNRDGDEWKPGDTYLPVDTFDCVQCWGKGELLDTIMPTPGEDLPDIAELNKQIPKEEWPEGFDGQPREPWVHNRVVHLLRVRDASIHTYINSTIGARIAVDRLREKIDAMQMLRGRRVIPLVKLTDREMKTRFGKKRRPEFEITDWRVIGGEDGGPKQIGVALKDTPAGEFLNDAIPF